MNSNPARGPADGPRIPAPTPAPVAAPIRETPAETEERLRSSEGRFRLLSETARRLLDARDPNTVVDQLCQEVLAYLECHVFFHYVVEHSPPPARRGSSNSPPPLARTSPANSEPNAFLTGRNGSVAHTVPRLHMNAFGGISEAEARQVEWLDYGEAVCGAFWQDHRRLLVEDIQHTDDPRMQLLKGWGIQACCSHLLLDQGRVLGILGFGTATRSRFRSDEVELMGAISHEFASAMRRSKTVRDLEWARAEADYEKNLLAALMQTLPVGLAILDANGGLLRTNPAYEELWGGPDLPPRSLKDYTGYPAWWGDSGRPVQRDERASVRALEHGETVVNQELQIQRTGGSRAWVLNSAAPIRDAEGAIVGCAVAIRDISDRKQAEDLRRQLDIQVQKMQKEESLSVLAGGIAHDFNNLLTVVIGNLGLASAEIPAKSGARRSLEQMEQAARRAAELCQQMLAYAGKTPLSFSEVRLNALLQDTCLLIKASLSPNAELLWDLAELAPSVHADPVQLRQMVMNLLINASEAIGDQPGQITVATACTHCTSNDLKSPWTQEFLPAGEYAMLEVSDTGCGMDTATVSRIFEPFYSTKFTGRGLGLAAVLGIVRSHHGAIQVQSEPGRGSTFRVWLPALPGKTEGSGADGAPPPEWRGSGTILLIDDEEDVRCTVKAMLELLGFETVAAASGLEGVEIYRANPERVCCVLLDATMPQMSGEATYRELARIRPDVRVVISSGYSKQDIIERFEGHELAGFLQKPYTLANLASALFTATRSA